jgi:hypothetical protein
MVMKVVATTITTYRTMTTTTSVADQYRIGDLRGGATPICPHHLCLHHAGGYVKGW